MKYNAFLFDFDGTVLDTVEAIVLTVRETFKHFNFPIPSDAEIKKYIGIPLHNYFPYLAKEYYERHKPEDVVGKYREIYAASYGRTHIKVFPGMKDMLLDLKKRGAKLGIVSSKMTEPIHMNLRDMDLEGIFDAVIGSNQVKQYKPLPQTVFLCAHLMGLEDARRALVLGDSEHDIEMGHRAAMDTCAVPWGAGTVENLKEAKPTYFVKTISDLHNLLLK